MHTMTLAFSRSLPRRWTCALALPVFRPFPFTPHNRSATRCASRSFSQQHLAYALPTPASEPDIPFQPTIPTHRPLPPHTVTTRIPGPFPLSLHSAPLPHLDVNWSIAGNPTGPTVFICPSMSHSAFVTRSRAERTESAGKATTAGWWESVVGWGEEYGVDLTRFQVVSASPLGGPFGTSSPLSMDDSRGQAFCASFPVITPLDQARCHHALLQHLHRHPALLPPGYRVSLPLYAIVGSSMGGMAAIHFSTSFPQQSDRVVAVCTTPLTSASTQALRSTQRAAVRMDPLYAGGRYTRPPLQGLRLARMMGTICYRSRVEFDQRFSPLIDESGRFPVERYLDHVGWAFGGRYDANCYLLLSECMDRMDVGQIDGVCARVSYDEAVERVSKDSEWMLLPVTEDALIPAEESDRWASALGAAGVRVHHERISSLYGHDAFLKSAQQHSAHARLRSEC